MSEFILPDIGEGIVECEVVKWLVAEGDCIEEDQPVVEVMTDKALVEIPSTAKGRVTRLYYREGEVAKVHTPLFAWQGDSETLDAPPPSRPPRPPASPAVRRLVREHGVDLGSISGSGKEGRVLKEDVLAHIESDSAATDHSTVNEGRVEPLRGARAVMARRMSESAQTVPHFGYSDDVDVTDLLALHERLKPRAEQVGVRLTLMPLFMKALALAVQTHPLINSRLNDDMTAIHYPSGCHIGMAVDSEAGLIVPNVKHTEQLTILEIAREVSRLTREAREGRIGQADLQGGSITISNIGVLGGTHAVPIINSPEVAIVAIGKIQWLPRFDAAGNVVARALMTVNWSGDHRVLDGGHMARFCNEWKGYLETPDSMLLHMG
ncbi:2-oxo acid dehydrogenase subunit E2 [Aidingimonas lacisalsi]|uniref:2-oxo acid dehydrogenase subunit E2 n=1 Tax=Aidingimonas lacisalsi TaxID=2604086 RepID=UPI0011D19CAE|nr:2-oxo acid dehydrogenase subunit E2 [Aidingimonas lacisalsi]